MDWFSKGVLTAAMVAVVLFTARGWGRRAAGWLAGLPVTSAPTIAWVALDHGTGLAADAAVASVAVCGLLALVALVVALALARRRRAAVFAGVAAAAFGLMLPWLAVHGGLRGAMLAAAAGCALALWQWPKSAVRPRGSAGSWRSMLVTSAAAGMLSVVAAAAGPAMGMATAGWLASLPVVSGSAAAAVAATGGAAAVVPFLHGYVLGLIGRIAFGAVFVLGLAYASLPTVLLLACASAVVCHLLAATVAAGFARSWALRKLAPCPLFTPPSRVPARPH